MLLKQELEQRGLLNQYTHEAFFELYDQGNQTLYVGMDPTADSLHIGNFVGFMHAVQYMKRGNHLVFIIGGATGMIGDPGGKDSERSFLDEATLQANIDAISAQVGRVLDNLTELSGAHFSWEVKNNLDFYEGMSYIGFLREVGKHITVNQMIAKETVKRRVEDPEQSISYTEFSYMLMQGYDFLRLYQEHDCKLQIAGSDQWGNIVTGIELIRKKLDQEAYGATTPLILDSTGKKFGKSEGNAVWLNPDKNSPFFVYQYFMNTSDEDVERFLKIFTLLSFEQIEAIIAEHEPDRSQRIGQQQLAYYVAQTIFGKEAAEHAKLITEVLFGQQDKLEIIRSMNVQAREALNHATSNTTTATAERSFIELCVESGLVSSNGEAKKMMKSGALWLNEKQIQDPGYTLSTDDYINNLVLLRKGKKSYATVYYLT